MFDDAELLRRYAESGSEAAFTELVGRHLNLVYFTALRATAGDAALAQDVVQLVFTAAARKARALSAHTTLAGWLYTTTRYTALRARRNQLTRRMREQEAFMHELTTAEPAHEWERLRPVIDDALEELSVVDRDAILVRFFEGRPFAELGAAWRISADGARMRVERALEKLRTALERRGIGSVATALAVTLATQGGMAAPAGMVSAVSSAAIAAGVAPGGISILLGFMNSTKVAIGVAGIVAVFTTGTALVQSHRAQNAEGRLRAVNQQQTRLQAEMIRAEQRRTAAETRAAEAEKDNGTLLAAVKAAGAKSTASVSGQPASSLRGMPSSNDPLAQTLHALFPNGIVAILNDRTITVDDVRREIIPILPKFLEQVRNPEELTQRLYKLQNDVIGDLITRQLWIKEFNNPLETEPAKRIAAEVIDATIAERMREQFGNDEAKFRAYLDAQGFTPAQYRQDVEEDIIYSFMRKEQQKLNPPKSAPAKSAP